MANDSFYNQITRDIGIGVTPIFLEEQSNPEEDLYVWAYQVRISNLGSETVRLRTRSWRITDARGSVQEIHGAGVVGSQPMLGPGESFDYTSGTPLTTSSGIMDGTYGMETATGEAFEAEIPAFSLDSPYQSSMLS